METVQEDTHKETRAPEDPEASSDPKAEFISTIKDPQQHYSNVKMKYFASLGMSKTPSGVLPSGMEGTSFGTSQSYTTNRDRTKTVPTPMSTNTEPTGQAIPIHANRKRSVSGPALLKEQQNGIPIPGRPIYRGHQREPSDDEPFFTMDSPTESFANDNLMDPNFDDIPRPRGFIPPHEMLQHRNLDFEVGTARSLAIFEMRRRNKMNVT